MIIRRALLGLGLALPALAQGQVGFPSRPIRLIVGFPPGGGSDLVARPIAQRMSETLGQQVVVENRGGANGNLGLEAVARSQPDGYTFGHVNDSVIAINPLLYRNLPFDPARELTPVGIATQGGMFVMVPAEMPVRNMAELVALLRARPGEMNFGSAGQGSVTHLGYTLFAREAGISMEVVTYRGSAPALQDMLGGRVQLMIDGINLAKAQIDAGRVRALAFIGGTERHPGFPDVPTTTEAGLPGFVMRGWQGFVGRAGTPEPVLDALEAAMRGAVEDAGVTALFASQGIIPRFRGRAEMGRAIAEHTALWRPIIQDLGLRLD